MSKSTVTVICERFHMDIRTWTWILFFMVSSILVNCDNNDEKLPNATMEGRNTFGCYVNGALLVGSLDKTRAEVIFRKDSMVVSMYGGIRNTRQNFNIVAVDKGSLQVGKRYNFVVDKAYLQYTDGAGDQVCFYNQAVEGFVVFSKVDIAKSIISGTFEYDGTSVECNDAIEIREGRFDVGTLYY